uniref:Uncharacterized protein n=1 Tax=Arundo donax TaxID=35708 RepID=A0A0A9A9Y1_ARUDO
MSSHTASALPPSPLAMAGGHHQMIEESMDHAPPPKGIHEVGGGGQGQAGVTTSFGAAPFPDMGGFGFGPVSLTLGLQHHHHRQQQQQFGGEMLGDLIG